MLSCGRINLWPWHYENDKRMIWCNLITERLYWSVANTGPIVWSIVLNKWSASQTPQTHNKAVDNKLELLAKCSSSETFVWLKYSNYNIIGGPDCETVFVVYQNSIVGLVDKLEGFFRWDKKCQENTPAHNLKDDLRPICGLDIVQHIYVYICFLHRN